jgi:predicted GTPase
MTVLLEAPRRLQDRIRTTHSQLRRLIEQVNNLHLKESWPRWEHRLEELASQAREKPQFSISLVGSIGAGKTTLINALLGARLLPTKEGQACTSAVCEISHSGDDRFHAEVSFLSRADWEQEVERLRADLRASLPTAGDTEEDREVSGGMVRAALQKLRAVYRTEEGAEGFLRNGLREPVSVTRALNAGSETFSYGPDEAKEFNDHVKLFLASDHAFWPLVRSVSISGPFPALEGGVKLIDLPGVNDPNEAREQVTRKHLKECKFVWLMFGVKRGLMRDVVEVMRSEDFFRQLIMDGRTDRLTFIATHADDINFEEACDQYKLDPDASITDILQARKENLKTGIEQTLAELAAQLADRAGEDQTKARELAKRLSQFTLFSVSARDYLAFQKRVRTPPRLETAEQTEIPSLRAHLLELARAYGAERHAQALQQQLKVLLHEVEREVRAEQVGVEQRSEMNVKQLREVQAAANAALTFLDGKLKEFRERYGQDLRSRREVLMERFKHGKQKGREGVDATLTSWEKMHQNTLAAVCRNKGRTTTTTGRHDLAQDLTKPLLDSIAFTWEEFFSDRLNRVTEEWHGKLLQLAHQQAQKFEAAVHQQLQAESRLRPDLKQFLEMTEKVLSEQLAHAKAQLQDRIVSTRATLYERVPTRVRAHLAPACQKAGKESGKGMKQRIIDEYLRPAAFEVARVVFQDVEQEIDNELRALQDTLVRSYSEMTDTVRRHADTNAKNIGEGAHGLSVKAIENERRQLQAAAKMLEELAADNCSG